MIYQIAHAMQSLKKQKWKPFRSFGLFVLGNLQSNEIKARQWPVSYISLIYLSIIYYAGLPKKTYRWRQALKSPTTKSTLFREFWVCRRFQQHLDTLLGGFPGAIIITAEVFMPRFCWKALQGHKFLRRFNTQILFQNILSPVCAHVPTFIILRFNKAGFFGVD